MATDTPTTNTESTEQHETFLTINQVISRISLSKSAIYRRLDSKCEQYDPSFPRPIKLGRTSSRWIEREINDWISKLIESQRSPI